MTSRGNGTGREVIAHTPLFDFRPDWGPATHYARSLRVKCASGTILGCDDLGST